MKARASECISVTGWGIERGMNFPLPKNARLFTQCYPSPNFSLFETIRNASHPEAFVWKEKHGRKKIGYKRMLLV